MRLLGLLGLCLLLACSDSTTSTRSNVVIVQIDGVTTAFKKINQFGFFDADSWWAESYEAENVAGDVISLRYKAITDPEKLLSITYKIAETGTEYRSDNQLESEVVAQDGELSSGKFSGVLTSYSQGSRHIRGSFKFAPE